MRWRAPRHYLDSTGEHPDEPLVAMVPILVRTEELKGTGGNQVASRHVARADIDDPVERLQAIHNGMLGEQQNAIGAETLQNWAESGAGRRWSCGSPAT